MKLVLPILLFALVITNAKADVVGTIGGQFAVSETGAATYTIPIEVPLGVGGMQPNIALTYNSQSGNGVVGMGFSLSGLSVISRVPHSVYYDGKAEGIKYNVADALAFNGQRLLLVSGQGGSDGAIYNTENDPITKITLRGSGTTQWFEVVANGITMKFGSTANGRQIINGAIVNWYVDYAEDTHGNYMTYTYTVNNNCVYISKINYGKNKNISSTLDNVITFNYASRTDVTPFIVKGVVGKMTQRLSSIVSTTASSVYRQYELSYSTDIYSRLTSVKEKGTGTEYLPAHTFSWNTMSTNNISSMMCSTLVEAQFTKEIVESETIIVGDITGDGLEDIISVREENGSQVNNVYKNTGSNFSMLYKKEYPNNYKFNKGIYNINNSITGTLYDFNGDGINEFVVPTIVSNAAIYITVNNQIIPISFNSSISFNISSNNLTSSYEMFLSLDKYQSTAPIFTIGDFFNQKQASIVCVETQPASNGTGYNYYINSPASKTFDKKYEISIQKLPKKIFSSDYNGDGLCDIMIVCDGGYVVYWNRGVSTSEAPFTTSNKYESTTFGNYDIVYPGDFNGDGYEDYLLHNRNSNDIYYAISNGNGSFTKKLAINSLSISDHSFTGHDDNKFNLDVLDFNGDGKSDVVITKSMYHKKRSYGEFDKTYTYWLQSNGDALTLVKTASSNKSDDGLCNRFMVGDFDGDGYTEMVNYGYDCYGSTNANVSPSWHIYDNGYTASTNKISTITGDWGRKTNITYNVITNSVNYSKGSGAAYPMVDLIVPMHIVASINESVGSSSQTTSYTYEGLKAHLQGKGVLGFNKVISNNSTTGQKTERSISSWNTTYYIPSAIKQTTTLGGKTSSATTTMKIVSKGGKRYFAYPSTISESDLYENVTTTTNSYNETNCYINSQEIKYNDGSYKKVAYESYGTFGGVYKPKIVTTTQKHKDASSAFTNKTTYEYATNGDLVSKTVNANVSNNAIISSYKYDVVGNITETSTKAGSLSMPTILYVYDSTKRFVTNENSTYKYVYTYDKYGNVLTKTDNTNSSTPLKTTYTYDTFGQMLTATDALGTKTTITRGFNNNSYNYYWVQTATTNEAPIKVSYDNCGREVLSETIGEGGVAISTETNYNYKWGNVASVVNKVGSITTRKTYTYDNFGRIATSDGNASPSITYSYANRYVTVKDNTRGASKVTTYDAWGNVKKITDAVSSIEYTYSSNGNPSKITSGGASFTMGYDEVGNQTSLNDPDAGTTTYTYDSFGRISTQTDARGIKTTNTYDSNGNITKTVCGSVTTLYTYNAYQNLTQESVSGGASISYTYDKFQRITQKKYVIDGESFIFAYSYNSNGLLVSKTYPDGMKEEYVYDENGNVNGVLFNGQPVWGGVHYMDLQRYVKIGDFVDDIHQYTSEGYLTKIDNLSSKIMVGTRYTYDAKTGNMTYRSGVNTSAENFTYDNMDRLTTGVSYAANGNISSKTDLGAYTYDTKKPHAVASVANTSGKIPTATRSVSYTAFNKVEKVTQGAQTLNITYGPDRQRVKTVYDNGTAIETRLYMDGYEHYTAMPSSDSNLTEDHGRNLCLDSENYSRNSITTGQWYTKQFKFCDLLMSRGFKKGDCIVVSFDARIVGASSLPAWLCFNSPYTTLAEGFKITDTKKRFVFKKVIDKDIPSLKTNCGIQIGANATSGLITLEISNLKCEFGTTATEWTPAPEDLAPTINGSVVSDFYYVNTPDGLRGVYVKNSSGTGKLYLAQTDNLGTILRLYDSNGTIAYRATYDPWGARTVTTNTINFQRGFTGHEHWDNLGLIDMNGRFYDPLLARFLSPDPYVQAPDNSQNFNRYSYCLNNPLKYTDPSGEFFTWSIFTGGLSFGINLTPIGIPIGFGTNFGWDGGFSMGTYFEAGPRIGGTCLGMGATASQSYDYNFTQKNFSTTFGIGAYASVACFTANAGLSNTYDFTNGYWSQGWNVGAGIGIGNDNSGIAIGVNYGGDFNGNNALSYGLSGFFTNTSGNKWETIADYKLPDGDLPIHHQIDSEVGCTQETLESFAEYYKRPINVTNKTCGMDLTEAAKAYGLISERIRATEYSIGKELTKNHCVGITYNNLGVEHTVGINEIKIQRRLRMNGNYKIRTIIKVMNPLLKKHYGTITSQQLHNSIVRSVYFPF